MTGNKVQKYLDSTLMGFSDERHEVIVGSEAGIHPVIIHHVVSSVNPARFKQGIEPDGSHAQRLDVVHLGQNAGNISDTIPVRILEGGRINLIDYGIAKPFGTFFPGLPE